MATYCGRRRWNHPTSHHWGVFGCCPHGDEVALYQFFDRQGDLLYVGITNRPAYRFGAHRHKPWFKDAYCYTTEMFPNRDEARAVEWVLIRLGHPSGNIQGVTR